MRLIDSCMARFVPNSLELGTACACKADNVDYLQPRMKGNNMFRFRSSIAAAFAAVWSLMEVVSLVTAMESDVQLKICAEMNQETGER